MAFGGVATGNMKAYEQVTVAGSISSNGFTFMVMAISERIGSRILTTAVLEATSVIVAVMMQTMSMIANGGRTLSPDSWAPIKVDRPEIFEASDRANPLPGKLVHLRIARAVNAILIVKKKNVQPRRSTIDHLSKKY